MFFALGVIVFIWTIYLSVYKAKSRLGHIPGPPGLPILGNTLQVDQARPRLTFLKWFREYGACYKVRLLMDDVVVVSGTETVPEVLIQRGKLFSNRPQSVRLNYTMKNFITFRQADAKWKKLRSISQRHLKAYGENVPYLQYIVNDIAGEMFESIRSSKATATDPWPIIRDCSVKTMSFFILGEKLPSGYPLMERIFEYANDSKFLTSVSPTYFLLEIFPFLINFPLTSSKTVKEWKARGKLLWSEIKQHLTESFESLVDRLKDEINREAQLPGYSPDNMLTEDDIPNAVFNLIGAGVKTSAFTFYAFINTLAHRPDIQENIFEELSKTQEKSFDLPSLEYRSEMPYTRATLFETLRYFTVAHGVLRQSTREDTEITGYGPIPKGTSVMVNLWAFHHDGGFWKNPETFHPERFLDDTGELVLPDHPNRKHLLPFGAGYRVCPGEVFALARLFLWMVGLVQNFVVCPAPGNTPDWLNPDIHENDINLKPKPYHVEFHLRDSVN